MFIKSKRGKSIDKNGIGAAKMEEFLSIVVCNAGKKLKFCYPGNSLAYLGK